MIHARPQFAVDRAHDVTKDGVLHVRAVVGRTYASDQVDHAPNLAMLWGLYDWRLALQRENGRNMEHVRR